MVSNGSVTIQRGDVSHEEWTWVCRVLSWFVQKWGIRPNGH